MHILYCNLAGPASLPVQRATYDILLLFFFSLFIFNGPLENQNLSRNASARFHQIFRMVDVWVQMINLHPFVL